MAGVMTYFFFYPVGFDVPLLVFHLTSHSFSVLQSHLPSFSALQSFLAWVHDSCWSHLCDYFVKAMFLAYEGFSYVLVSAEYFATFLTASTTTSNFSGSLQSLSPSIDESISFAAMTSFPKSLMFWKIGSSWCGRLWLRNSLDPKVKMSWSLLTSPVTLSTFILLSTLVLSSASVDLSGIIIFASLCTRFTFHPVVSHQGHFCWCLANASFWNDPQQCLHGRYSTASRKSRGCFRGTICPFLLSTLVCYALSSLYFSVQWSFPSYVCSLWEDLWFPWQVSHSYDESYNASIFSNQVCYNKNNSLAYSIHAFLSFSLLSSVLLSLL